MKIIDRETKKRLNKKDPIKRDADKQQEEKEWSPMDPPSAYEGTTVKVDVEAGALKQLTDEHKAAKKEIDSFEKALIWYKENGFQLTKEINSSFASFFNFFDDSLLPHNRKEEKFLFPELHQKLIENGEHSTDTENPQTAIDMMEDDHIKFIQLGTLTFNLLGLAPRLQDPQSRTFVLDTAYQNGRELIELLRLHIYREDEILFPLAQKYLPKKSFERIRKELHAFDA